MTPADQLRSPISTRDAIVESVLAALSEYTTEDLRVALEDAERISADSWLAKMLREFLDVWR